jgi:DNA invertase Pin-like site-specific DNA recombinase
VDEPKDSKAIAYLRRSRVDETRTGAVSYEAQEAAVRTMARRWDAGEPELLVDWGRSGGSEKRRPAYLKLRAMVEAGQVTDIFSYDLSRLTRSLEEWIRLATLCQEHGVRIHLSKEGTFDFSTASGEMLANILASVAQAVRRWASERSRETATALRARGATIGRKPYGSRPGENLDAIRTAVEDAGSFYGAARLLNDRGLSNLKGRPWTASTVSFIVRHQLADLVPARPGTAGPQRPSRFTLQKLVRCHCGRFLSPYSYHSGRKTYTTYRCNGGKSDPVHGRPYAVSEPVLLDWARAEAAHLAIPADLVEVRQVSGAEHGELDARRLRILDMYEAGHIDVTERDRRLAPVYGRLEELDAVIASTSLEAIPAIDWTLPPGQLNRILRTIWTQIEVGPDLRPVRAEWTVPEWRAA